MKYNRMNANKKLNTSHLGIGGQKPLPIYVIEKTKLCLQPRTSAVLDIQVCLGSQLQDTDEEMWVI